LNRPPLPGHHGDMREFIVGFDCVMLYLHQGSENLVRDKDDGAEGDIYCETWLEGPTRINSALACDIGVFLEESQGHMEILGEYKSWVCSERSLQG